ncbi:hypothetical protein [Neptuniibacter sp. QD34_54]|uniref:hypothetical protein n=1 Tax=Neptuniibacter sp. QD34_54 TaxID=3398208 RepID=UPI0039F4A4EC
MGRLALHKTLNWVYWGGWFVLAGLLEYLQGALQPLRHFSIGDALANATGVAIALIACITIAKFLRNRSTSQN